MITDPTRVSDLRIWLLASLYFALNALTQGWVSPTADLDQAQQLVLSQNWNLGYGTQPPLYTWLVNILFAITGPSLWVLLALKSLLLSLLAAGILAIGRELGFDGRRQLMALAGLALIPQVIWEAQRDLTHSLLATLVASWTLWSLDDEVAELAVATVAIDKWDDGDRRKALCLRVLHDLLREIGDPILKGDLGLRRDGRKGYEQGRDQ